MAIRVVILRQGSPLILKQWDEEYISPLNLEQWEKGSCLWPSSFLNDQTEPMEVFLCLGRVVKAALHSNGAREAILKGFGEGRKVLKIEDPDAIPVAFWARH
jgi:hypothetical protein